MRSSPPFFSLFQDNGGPSLAGLALIYFLIWMTTRAPEGLMHFYMPVCTWLCLCTDSGIFFLSAMSGLVGSAFLCVNIHLPGPIPPASPPHINLKSERMLQGLACVGCSCVCSIPAPFLQPSYLKQHVTAILWSTLQTQALL